LPKHNGQAYLSLPCRESEYPGWFNKWGVRKRIHTAEKEDIVTALGKRTHPETSTSNVTLDRGKAVDKRQMRRYLGDQVRRHRAEPMWPGV
jgi:hypothetical protein